MEASLEEKKKEAIDRMTKIGLFPQTIKDFDEDGRVSYSEPPLGACYWLDDAMKAVVADFEESYNALVYHVIHGTYVLGGTDIMTMDCLMYVSDHPEEWELDRDDISDPDSMQALCYVYNATDPVLSELGAVGFKLGPAGGLIRTW